MKGTEKQKIIEVTITGESSSNGKLTMGLRSYFSTYHLWAAEHFSKLAAEIEDGHEGRSRFNLEHRVYVVNSILSAVVFLEAAINEVFQDAHDDHQSYIQALNSGVIQDMATYWANNELNNIFVPILDKYQNALKIAGQKEFVKGENPYQDTNLVIDLRNFLTHYKPKTLGGDTKHILHDKLKNKFPLNKIYEQSGNPDFPDKMLSKGCAEWSFKSVRNFADEFFKRMSIQPNYQKVDIDKLAGKK